ncbi:hypothetical protein Pmgp_03730 [Pelotomaculum propionicicum]|uniref:Uncharacterized protein n=1 Tax=Pelotomaculum propionicicum TaxID=258475 RepID=A0A4Y7RCI6_9FIRM|nr:hypothetical protein Pmgp_03730 [Pelotomaculum propionicicum]
MLSTAISSSTGSVTASIKPFMPQTSSLQSPVKAAASPRASSRPSLTARIRLSTSLSRPLTASIQPFTLFLISLKSPLYSSVIFGGMSPLEIRSTYSAATLRGPITASRVLLTPSTTLRKSPSCLLTSALASSFPSTAALASMSASATRLRIASIALINDGMSSSFSLLRPIFFKSSRSTRLPRLTLFKIS